jgi:glycosyltransferase involved in cell wall biosynthesis
MTKKLSHICVCICTFKRPDFLARLLKELASQETGGQFAYSIVVADNDSLRSAESCVVNFAAASEIPIRYCVEPRQNIALARNKAVENADGDFIAFIDDDEFPAKNWLLSSFQACEKYQVDGVVGPVKRHFDEKPPKWVVEGNFYERPTYATGFVIDWSQGRTNNVLLRRQTILPGEQPFRPEFRSGEDQDFFRRAIARGHAFVWCNEAQVFEVVPPVRWNRSFILRRALLQGTVSVLHPTFGAREVVKSLLAVPIYSAALPFTLILAHHRFMTLLVKLFNHVGLLLALLKINIIREPYVTD